MPHPVPDWNKSQLKTKRLELWEMPTMIQPVFLPFRSTDMLKTSDSKGRTCLHVAAENGHLEMCQVDKYYIYCGTISSTKITFEQISRYYLDKVQIWVGWTDRIGPLFIMQQNLALLTLLNY